MNFHLTTTSFSHLPIIRHFLIFYLVSSSLAYAPSHIGAQSPYENDQMGFRIGVTAGGIGLLGISFELRRGNSSVDLNLATFDFKDVSLAVTGKQYLGNRKLQPFLGIGIWGVNAFPKDHVERTGRALLLRIPLGVDWRLADAHSLGGSIALNEGLWVQRANQKDDRPISRRPVFLPGFYYRVRSNP